MLTAHMSSAEMMANRQMCFAQCDASYVNKEGMH